MNLVFFIKSATIDINKYTIKDIPGSSGRLDVISRCILSALLGNNGFEKNVQIWVFLDNYGTYIFDSELLNYGIFPKNELLFTDYFVKLIREINSKMSTDDNPLSSVKPSEIDIMEALKQFIDSDYGIFVLKEGGKDFLRQINEIRSKKDILFVVGNQSGDFLNSEELLALNLPELSLGTQSYLASSVIRLIKLSLMSLL